MKLIIRENISTPVDESGAIPSGVEDESIIMNIDFLIDIIF